MNFLENITFRRSRRQSEPSNDDSDIISQTLNFTSNSMPDISEDDYNQIKNFKDEIDTLKAQLNSAHHEVESLTLENNNLKLCNEELLKKNNLLQEIVSSPVKQKQRTPIKKSSNIKTKSKQTQTINITQAIVGEDITTLDVGIKMNITDNVCTSGERNLVLQTTNTGKKTSPALRTPPTSSEPSIKHKIALLSGETSNRLYSMAEKTYLNNFEFCHYRKPKCGIELIFDNIDAKVQEFTEWDYCIIYIGEEDFRTTHNYIELVSFIREKLLPLNHTNFIICLPTFKYMEKHNIMYNSRIDTFNNLLYMDVQTYMYAYVLDSNLNLPYTYNTYNRHSTLNNKGLNIIVSDLEQLVIKLCSLDKVFSDVDCAQNNKYDSLSQPELLSNSQFFL